MQSHKRARIVAELAASHLTELDRNSEVCTAENVRWLEKSPAVSHKMELARRGEVYNAAYPNQVQTDLLPSYRIEHARMVQFTLHAKQNR